MIEGIEALCGWMEIHQCPFWKIFYSTKGSQFLAANDTTNDIGQAIVRLRSAFDKFSEGRYIIVCREELESNKQKGLAETIFIHTKQGNSSPNAVQHIAPAISEDHIEKRVTEALDKFKTELRIKDLERERDELKQELKEIQPTLLQNRFAAILPELKPYIGGIMEKIGVAKQSTSLAVSGIDPEIENAPSETSDDQTRLQNALELWSEADPDGFINLIEKLAHFAHEKPEQYNSYIPMIDNFLR